MCQPGRPAPQGESHAGDEEGLQPCPRELRHIGLQADFKEEEKDANFRQQLDRFVRAQESEQARPDQHAREQFPDDRRRPAPARDFGEEARRHEDDHQLQEEFVRVHGLDDCHAVARVKRKRRGA